MLLKKQSFEFFAFEYIFIMALISNYIENYALWRIGQGTIFILLFLLYKKSTKRYLSNYRITVPVVLYIFLYVASIIASDDYTFLLTNTVKLLAPVLSCLIISKLSFDDPSKINKMLVANFWIINIWWIANIIIILIQVSGVPLFIKTEWLSQNRLYADLCCGLFGYNRTHEICFFSCFVTIFNVSCSKGFIKFKKYLTAFFVIISVLAAGYVSVFNDNIAFFLFLPAFVLIYLYFYWQLSESNLRKRVKKYLFIIISIAVIIFICSSIKPIVDTFDEIVVHRVERVLFAGKLLGATSGSNERLAQILYVLDQSESWLFGSGIGHEIVNEHFSNGFAHFGMNSASSSIWLVGVWTFLLHLVIISQCILTCMHIPKKKRKKFFVVCFFALLVITSYSNILISQSSVVWIALCFVSMSLTDNKYKRIESGEQSCEQLGGIIEKNRNYNTV